jgi:nicotinamide-nucleotide amidase
MDLETLATQVGQELQRRKLVLATAESCTGGWVSQVITACPNSSQWFDRGFVTYTNLAKQELLGVSETVLAENGAVSEKTARAMAEGAIARSKAQVALSITGIAGPTGGTPEKPVGTVWFAWAGAGHDTVAARYVFEGDRHEVRRQAVERALQRLIEFIR